MNPTEDIVSPRGPDGFRIARVREHSFLAAPITPQSTVVDLGMNVGKFATTMISGFGCSVVGVEPVPDLFAAIPKIDRLTADQFAINADGRPVSLFRSSSPLGATIDGRLSEPSASTVEVKGITFADILDRYEIAQTPLVKVDVEGAEIQMLDSTPVEVLQRADQFTIEFHDFLDDGQADDVLRVKQRLRTAGFIEMAFSTDNTDVLFVNASRVAFTGAHRAAAAIAYKYPRGIARNLNRRIRDRRAASGR